MALPSTYVFEVRTTGNDLNGGAFDPNPGTGTDYSQQDAAQLSVTDANATGTTNLNSATGGFTSVMINNGVQISGGTLTAGLYNIATFVNSNNVTLDRTPGTGSGSTAKVGGALASPGQAMAFQSLSNTVFVKSPATYVLSSTANVSGGRINITAGGSAANAPFQLIGYSTNRTLTNSDTPPELDAGASMAGVTVQMIFMNSLYLRVRNFKLRNPNSYAGGSVSTMLHMGFGGAYNLAERMDIDANNVTNWFGIFQANNNECHCYDCAVRGTNGQFGINSGGSTCSFHGCYVAGCVAVGYSGAGQFDRCIAYNNTGAASDGFNSTSAAGANYINCDSVGNGRDGFAIYYDGKLDSCLSTNNAGYGFNLVALNNGPIVTLYNCAGFNNTLGNVNGGVPSYAKYRFVTLTADPFNNPAGGDFGLNNTAGGGAACKGVGYPSSFYTISTSSSLDLGASQSTAAAAASLNGAIILIQSAGS